MSTRRNVLYRFYNEADELLYIGISMTPWERFRQHRTEKPWWDDIATIRKQDYPDRESVLAAEKAAIIAEHPLHNVIHNGASLRIHTSNGIERTPTKWVFREPDEPPMFLVRSATGRVHFGEFRLVYEVMLDPIGDDYYWDDIDPRQLFLRWHQQVSREGNGYVPIYWFVAGPGVFESAYAEQREYLSRRGGFLSYYDHPLDARNRPVDLHELPVIDKRWDEGRQDKGGFLPVATGWKPYALQQEVSLQDLRNMASRRHWALMNSKWELVAS